MGFSRQEYWSGLPFPSPGDLPNPGLEPRSPALQADSFPSEPPDCFKMDNQQEPAAQLGELWPPGLEEVGENGHMCMCGSVSVLSTCNYHNTVSWLCPNINEKLKKKKELVVLGERSTITGNED